MIGKELSEENTEYIFLEFNAWLYQGFDEAKIALLQSVSDKLLEKAQTDEKLLEKVKKLVKKLIGLSYKAFRTCHNWCNNWWSYRWTNWSIYRFYWWFI